MIEYNIMVMTVLILICAGITLSSAYAMSKWSDDIEINKFCYQIRAILWSLCVSQVLIIVLICLNVVK